MSPRRRIIFSPPIPAARLLNRAGAAADELPHEIRGKTRVIRDGKTLWEDDFLSGEANMSHSVANLEHHHFKYDMFRRPGDLHAYSSARRC
jgi:hypothetical protein